MLFTEGKKIPNIIFILKTFSIWSFHFEYIPYAFSMIAVYPQWISSKRYIPLAVCCNINALKLKKHVYSFFLTLSHKWSHVAQIWCIFRTYMWHAWFNTYVWNLGQIFNAGLVLMTHAICTQKFLALLNYFLMFVIHIMHNTQCMFFCCQLMVQWFFNKVVSSTMKKKNLTKLPKKIEEIKDKKRK